MQTQRDRVHAYNALVGRMSAALLTGKLNYELPPARRLFFGLLCGVLASVLIGLGFGLYGLLRPRPSLAWTADDAVVVDQRTGSRYVWQGGTLTPVLNWSSAMLLTDGKGTVQQVSAATMAGVPLGRPVGIVGAPDGLPGALSADPLLLCLPRSGTAAGTATGDLSLAVPASPVSPARPLADGWAAVRDAAGAVWVLADDHRLPVVAGYGPVALGLVPGALPVAPAAFLRSLPAGPTIDAPPAPRGADRTVAGHPVRLGTLVHGTGADGSRPWFEVTAGGLAPITDTEAALRRAAGGRSVLDLDLAGLAAAGAAADVSGLGRLPDLVHRPRTMAGDRELCLVQTHQGGTAVTSTVATAAAGAAGSGLHGGTFAPSGDAGAAREPDREQSDGAAVTPGSGILVTPVPLPARALGDVSPLERWLITDTGARYRVTDDKTLTALGLSGAKPRPLDRDVLALVPAGPTLSLAAVGRADH